MSAPMQSHAKLNELLSKRYHTWMLIQQYANSTKTSRARTIQLFVEWLDGKLLTDATHMDVRGFIADRSTKGLCIASVNDELSALRMFYDFLHLGGMVGYVPPRLVRIRQGPRKLPRVLSESDILKMINACQNDRDKALIEFGYGTGCRSGEIRTVRIEDIDFHARTVRVNGKTGPRVVPLIGSASRAVRHYIRSRKSGFVFQQSWPVQCGAVYKHGRYWRAIWRDYKAWYPEQTSVHLGKINEISYREAVAKFHKRIRNVQLLRPKTNKPLSSGGIARIVETLGVRAGITDHVHPHMLRHSFATHLLDHGADVRVIQGLLGHAKLESTAIYTRLSSTNMQKTIEQCHPRGI